MGRDRTADLLEKYGIPGTDAFDLPDSPKRFPDGAHYRMEISGIERMSVLETVVEERKRRGVPVHKLICTVCGATLLDKAELRAMAELGAEERMEMIMTPGPRPPWETGRMVATPSGALCGMRLRGSEQLRQYVDDVLRLVELGFRGFLVWDEGALSLLSKMRKKGDLPKNVKFKVSVFAGQANPAGIKLVEELGANTANPAADISLPAFAAIRKVCDIPLDIHTYILDDFGGFCRLWDAPEFARCVAPCYFKIEQGPSMALYKPWVGDGELKKIASDRVKYAEIMHELVQRKYPELVLSEHGVKDLAIPQP
ncbi:MAG: U32 family peptidase [Planctomycetota bacterium]|nr:U32 family peptidase [Planctomycetota bacterium]